MADGGVGAGRACDRLPIASPDEDPLDDEVCIFQCWHRRVGRALDAFYSCFDHMPVDRKTLLLDILGRWTLTWVLKGKTDSTCTPTLRRAKVLDCVDRQGALDGEASCPSRRF